MAYLSRASSLALVLCTFLASCTDEQGPDGPPPVALPTPAIGQFKSATATIENKLPVDGCSYPVTVDGVQYAPDESSLPAIRQHLSQSTVTVQIRYRLTGNTGQVECGGVFRHNYVPLPEITVHFDE